MNKQKNMPYSHRRHFLIGLLKKVLKGIGVGFCLLLCGLPLFYIYISSGEFKLSIDPALLPTAQYLLLNPQPTLEYIRPELHSESYDLYPETDVLYQVCYRVSMTSAEDPRGLARSLWTEVYLNGARVPPIRIYVSWMLRHPSSATPSYGRDPSLPWMGRGDPSWPESSEICLDPNTGQGERLEDGLHLVEIYARQFPWEEPTIYQWAAQIGGPAVNPATYSHYQQSVPIDERSR